MIPSVGQTSTEGAAHHQQRQSRHRATHDIGYYGNVYMHKRVASSSDGENGHKDADDNPRSPTARKPTLHPLPPSASKRPRQTAANGFKTDPPSSPLSNSTNGFSFPPPNMSSSGTPKSYQDGNAESCFMDTPEKALSGWKMEQMKARQAGPVLSPSPSPSPFFTFTPQQEIRLEAQIFSNKLNSLTRHCPETDFQVMVVHVDFANSIWVWIAAGDPSTIHMTDLVDTMDCFSHFLKTLADRSPVPESLEELASKPYHYSDSIVIAPFEDFYYRARILDVAQNNTCEVLFVDYGNRSIVHFSDLRALPEYDLLGHFLPPMAFRSKIAGLNYGFMPDKDSFQADLETELLLGRVDKPMQGTVSASGSDITELILRDQYGRDIGARMIELGSQMPHRRIRKRSGVLRYPVGSLLAKVRFFESNSVIYVWPAGEMTAIRAKIQLMSDRMKQEFGRQIMVTQPEVGYFVAVKHGEDHFFRAVVLEVKYDSTALVRFLDFGNSEVVHFNTLYPLDDDDLDMAALALKCEVSWMQINEETLVIPIENVKLREYVQILITDFVSVDDSENAPIIQEEYVRVIVQLPHGVLSRPNVPVMSDKVLPNGINANLSENFSAAPVAPEVQLPDRSVV